MKTQSLTQELDTDKRDHGVRLDQAAAVTGFDDHSDEPASLFTFSVEAQDPGSEGMDSEIDEMQVEVEEKLARATMKAETESQETVESEGTEEKESKEKQEGEEGGMVHEERREVHPDDVSAPPAEKERREVHPDDADAPPPPSTKE